MLYHARFLKIRFFRVFVICIIFLYLVIILNNFRRPNFTIADRKFIIDGDEIFEGDLQLNNQTAKDDFEAKIYRNYCVYRNMLRNRHSSEEEIVMVLHLSVAYLSTKLLRVVQTWEGPISVAIFIDTFEEAYDPADALLRDIIKQEPGFDRVFVHFFLPLGDVDGCFSFSESKKSVTEVQLPNRTQHSEIWYPINAARNIARRFAPRHKYFLVADLEQEYSLNAASILKNYTLSRDIGKNKEVLVIRRFEHAENSTAPRAVAELQKRFHKDVFEFHEKYFKRGHSIVGVKGFFMAGDSSRRLKVIQQHDHLWEPMFVASADIPEYDETLRYQAMNQLALCWDLCVNGYTFLVVNAVFNSHRGIKHNSKEGYSWPSKELKREAYALAQRHKDHLKKANPTGYKRCFE